MLYLLPLDVAARFTLCFQVENDGRSIAAVNQFHKRVLDVIMPRFTYIFPCSRNRRISFAIIVNRARIAMQDASCFGYVPICLMQRIYDLLCCIPLTFSHRIIDSHYAITISVYLYQRYFTSYNRRYCPPIHK